ncbi:MAG: hypothetical protein Q9168_008160 [Polycauliona sp. 1 TL-2023]
MTAATPDIELGIWANPSNSSVSRPPPAFDVGPPQLGIIGIPDRAIFALVDKALSELVVLPFDSITPSSRVVRNQGVNAVLALSGPLGGGFPVKYMVWGLASAMARMVTLNSFRNYRFPLRWNGHEVGHVWILYGTPRDGLTANRTADLGTISQPMKEPVTPISGSNTALQACNVQCNLIDITSNPPMSLNDAMMAIISGYTDIAPFNFSQQTPGARFQSVWPPFVGRFELLPVRPYGVDPPLLCWAEILRRALDSLALHAISRATQPQKMISCWDNHQVLVAVGKLTLNGQTATDARTNVSVA